MTDNNRETVPRKEKTCLNCGHSGTGSFCSECGQNYSDLNRPMKELMGELMDNINLDRRIIRTLVPFIIKPGFLAMEYIRGRRQMYMSPIRLYIVMSLIFFFIASNSGSRKDISEVANLSVTANDSSRTFISSDEALLEYLTADSLKVGEEYIMGIEADSTSAELSGSWVKDAAIKALKNKELFMSYFYKNVSYILFFLMPVFALILFMLYIRRRHFYVEHLVFALNMHSFALLVLSIVLVTKLIWKENPVSSWLIMMIPIYFTTGMKRFYQQSWIKTIGKEVILGIVYSIFLLLSIPVVGLITLYLI